MTNDGVVCLQKGSGHTSLYIEEKAMVFFSAKQPVFLCRPRTRERSNKSSGTCARMKTESENGEESKKSLSSRENLTSKVCA